MFCILPSSSSDTRRYFSNPIQKLDQDLLVRLPNSQVKLVPMFYGHFYAHFQIFQSVQRKFICAHFPVDL